MRVLVIGGGVTGLTVCHTLQKHAPAIVSTLCEASCRLGGWVHTENSGHALFERGPRSLLTRRGEHTVKLVEALGIRDEIVTADKAAYRRYIWKDGKLNLVPTSMVQMLRSPLMKGVLHAGLREAFKSPGTASDESVYDFVARRFSQHAADYLVDPMVAGIYSGDPKRLSVKSCFRVLYDLERQQGSVVGGMLKGVLSGMFKKKPKESPLFARIRQAGGIYSFKDGMSTLTDALSAQVPHTTLRSGTEVESLQFPAPGSAEPVRVRLRQLSTGAIEEAEFDQVVSTVAAPALARILASTSTTSTTTDTGGSGADLLRELQEVTSASVYTVNVAYDQFVLPSHIHGFGFLVPSKENLNVLGVTFDSHSFPGQNTGKEETRLTVMMGGDRQPELAKKTPDEVQAMALDTLKHCLGITQTPLLVTTNLAVDCIPQYRLDHSEKIQRIHELAADYSGGRLAVYGTGVNGVSVNDCIGGALKAATALIQKSNASTRHFIHDSAPKARFH